MAKTFADLALKAKPYIPDVPQPTLEAIGKRVLTDFCEQTLVLRANANNITLLASTSSYAIAFGGGAAYEPCHIHRAKVGSRVLGLANETDLNRVSSTWEDDTGNVPTHVFLTFDKQVRVYPTPSANLTDVLSLSCFVTFSDAVTSFDDFLLNNFWRVLVDGMVAESRELPDRPFTQYDLSDRYRLKYRQALAQVRWAVMKNYGLGSIDVAPVSFEGY